MVLEPTGEHSTPHADVMPIVDVTTSHPLIKAEASDDEGVVWKSISDETLTNIPSISKLIEKLDSEYRLYSASPHKIVDQMQSSGGPWSAFSCRAGTPLKDMI